MIKLIIVSGFIALISIIIFAADESGFSNELINFIAFSTPLEDIALISLCFFTFLAHLAMLADVFVVSFKKRTTTD